jgi:hypothetical protein
VEHYKLSESVLAGAIEGLISHHCYVRITGHTQAELYTPNPSAMETLGQQHRSVIFFRILYSYALRLILDGGKYSAYGNLGTEA